MPARFTPGQVLAGRYRIVDGLPQGLAYLAPEPWVRRRNPLRWIGWSRLLEGDLRDPPVGRDVLLGVVAGAAVSAVTGLVLGVRGSVGGLSILILLGLGLAVLLRLGFLAYVVCRFSEELLTYTLVTTDLSAWYAGVSDLSLLMVVGLAGYGFLVARGGPGAVWRSLVLCRGGSTAPGLG